MDYFLLRQHFVIHIILSFLCFVRNLIKYRSFYIETKYFSDYKDLVMDTGLNKDISSKSSVAIYGIGPYGEAYFVDLFHRVKIVAVYDRKYYLFKSAIKSPEKINSELFDYIIVTVMEKKARKEILDHLFKKNIPKEKIICVNYLHY